MSNDPNWYAMQQVGMQNALGNQSYPETTADILAVALSRAKQKRDSIQKTLDSVQKLKDDLASFEALIARLEGREDE